MTSTGRAFGDRQAARRHLVMMAGTLILVLVVIDIVGLYGLDVIRRQSAEYAAATERMLEATDESRAAEVAFKTQVQEWKNILLRGHEPQDLARYRDAFHRQEAEVGAHLRQVREHAGELGLPAGSVDEVLALHADLAKRYDAALQDYDPGTPDAAWRVDRSVRGMDRPLTQAFESLMAEVRTLADTRRAAVQARMAEAAETQRLVLIAAHGIGIVLVLASLLMALRALRR